VDTLPWSLILALAASGVVMALISCLVGMRPKVENPAWWALYLVWIAVVLFLAPGAPFLTILVASTLAGLLHGITTALLLDAYRANNPWHAERTQGPRGRLAAQFIGMGFAIGLGFGAIVGGIAWGLSKI
jgi:hypothetical protein